MGILPRQRAFLLFLGAWLLPGGVTAQVGEAWNDSTILSLVERARVTRHSQVVDSTLITYTADARGYVYFFLHREDTDERILVKTDQIALEVYWHTPNRTRQRIVGLRDEESLPTNIRYHLDHLVVVQDEFGDLIRIGDGDEVSAVVHPMAPASDSVYDFSMGDSLTVTLGGPHEPVRVYEVRVRPKRFQDPGYVGSVFVDRATAAIVRMDFTFTPASYVDSYLDYIRISLDNGLWLGRHWLPYRQRLEIRREVPWLDIPAGSVIRGRFEIGNYRFNEDLSPALFRGRAITALPEEQRRAFPFEEGLHDQVDAEGLAPPPSLAEIRQRAMSLAGERYLSGLRSLRVHFPSFSDALRYNRAEGFFAGAGMSYMPDPRVSSQLFAGYAFGRRRPAGSIQISGGERAPATGIRADWNRLEDLGPVPGSNRLFNTLSSLFSNRDYVDPYFASGVEAFHTFPVRTRGEITARIRWERHRGARDVMADDYGVSPFRPVLPIEEGELAAISLRGAAGTDVEGLYGSVTTEVGRFRSSGYATIVGQVGWTRRWLTRGTELRGEVLAGAASSDAPLQSLFLLGGRGTLPGYDYRSFVGDRFWLVTAEASKSVLFPWVSVRGFGSVGATSLRSHPVPRAWPTTPTPIPLWSAGLGVALGWDVLRFDVGRGLNEGGWDFTVSIQRAFRAWL